MSKLVYLCSRLGEELPYTVRDMERVLARLTPDNLMPRPPRVITGEGALIGILNPADTLSVAGESVCLGSLFGIGEDWWRPGAAVPDGSYALFRGDGESLELVSDIVASRTIWYVQTQNLFIAATSQRAIVSFLQSFEPNEAVYPWMLSSGTLGPVLSWDRRIRCLGPDARLRLNRRSWEADIDQAGTEVVPEDLPRTEHERRLRETLEGIFAYIDLDPRHWVLPLSGGCDSRAILLFLKARSKFRSVTWGLKSALLDRKSDAWVARELARHFGLAHEYYELDQSDTPVDQIFERFLVAGEGRVDHISGYMDGFTLWRWLFESGCQAILRGDQAFGRTSGDDDEAVRLATGLVLLSDYDNIRQTDISAACTESVAPFLARQSGESLQQWNDRLFQTFRHPTILAALNDLKCSYVEIANPLLSRHAVHWMRRVPDHIRANKGLFRDIVLCASPPISFAERAATKHAGDILRQESVIGHIIEYLSAHDGTALCNGTIQAYIDAQLAHDVRTASNAATKSNHLKDFAKGMLSVGVIKMLKRLVGRRRKSVPRNLDVYRLAFRAYIICRMRVLLDQDARVLGRH
ncbi:MAG: hypothetical protein IT488_03040 [Gammaproteobacteria bacterium]|nr:hypothetical protein [Gammaproteobacteria bacterium]